MKVLIAGGGIGGVTAALALHAGVSKPRCSSRPGRGAVGIGINVLLPRAVKQDDARTLYGASVGVGS